MRTHPIRDLDRTILYYCADNFVLMHDLLGHVARGTLYRHLRNLLDAGLLAQRGRTYHTTPEGQRKLAELASHMDWNIWNGIYPPIQYVPSPQRRAVIELATAAVVARQADSQED